MNRPSLAVSIPEIACRKRADPRDSQEVQHLHQSAVAHRWHLSVRTLERWRWRRQGPKYIKVGGRVLYRLEDIEAFERAGAHECDSVEPK